jgi:large subunit ribosomal protein L15
VSLNEILSTDTGRKVKIRLARGIGSGTGKTGGRGYKGEGSRTGGKLNKGPLFEGGQFPLWMRLPRRGFSNAATRVAYQPIQLADALKRVEGGVISVESLQAAGLIHNNQTPKLVAGEGVKVSKKFDVQVKVTASARAAIEAAGGKVA